MHRIEVTLNEGTVRMNYKELVREAIKLLDVYKPDKQCVDTFIEESNKTLEV